ncbi:hypothetical protein MED217_07876 [Leeuwenhoekiella blandensis MED217]|uniref:Uncharacterized protein n=1 Tax=Leeuwenhoekiella blandensis (strain CECT 7118 / CCUG 51940 / KCTC 22103 / MED217) TaxID=398720 RepID=A3XMB7_LEEBM|nr:hypothetical protein MED217_07876 [Leeuwenhoekiella blandensis MED217]
MILLRLFFFGAVEEVHFSVINKKKLFSVEFCFNPSVFLTVKNP